MDTTPILQFGESTPTRAPRYLLIVLAVFAGIPGGVSRAADSPASRNQDVSSSKSDSGAIKYRLKAYQAFTTNAPPASPVYFNPDASQTFPFPQESFNRAVDLQATPQIHLSLGPPPLPPDAFDPDPQKPPTIFFDDTEHYRYRWRISPPPGAKPPTQFNPDPGAVQKTAEQSRPFFQFDITAPPDFGIEPLPVELMLPRYSLRLFEQVLVLPRDIPFGGGPLPARLRLPRQKVRLVETAVPPASEPYGLEPLPKDLELPRYGTRRNLPFHALFSNDGIPRKPDVEAPPNTEAKPNRWKIGFMPWQRYGVGSVETPYLHPDPYLWHPYRPSILKGDVPIIGQDIFLDLTATAVTEFEARRLPTPSGISAAEPGQAEFFGRSDIYAIQNNLGFSVEFFRGETVFKPVEWAVKLEPVYNLNYVNARETGVVSPDPRGLLGGGPGNNNPPPFNGGIINPGDLNALLNGQLFDFGTVAGKRHTVRTRDYWALQQAFVDIHLRDLSENYDFIAFRGGYQTFNSDFRGFLYNDTNLGFRLFGNAWNNRIQYNAAGFDQREKDTDSGLNTFDPRNQEVVIANLFWQDFFAHGYTAQWSFAANLDHGGIHYDRNGDITRPEPIGTVRPHDVDAYYLGWGGDGHIGRFNITHQFYQALGRDQFNGLAGRPVDINAQFAALELSYDRDWLRYKGTFVYASGEGKTEDRTARGFDSIVDNANFDGGPFSFYVHQGFNLAGTGVSLKQPNSLIPDLRTSKTEGQANFVNPGIFIYGVGLEADLTPKLKGFFNANYLRFANTDSIKTALLTDKIDSELGVDLSLGFQYRPFLTDNIILSTGFGALLPGKGFRDIYRRNIDPVPGFNTATGAGHVDDLYFGGLIAITLTY